MPELNPIRPVPPMARDMDLAANRPASTRRLAGAALILRYDEGGTLELRFSADRVGWSLDGVSGDSGYDAVELRPGILFVHFASEEARFGMSHVIDEVNGRAVTAWDEAPAGSGPLRRFVRTARVDGAPVPYVPIPESTELIGRRAYCEYSDEAALEHVYVNSAAILWQWLLLPGDPRFDPLRTEIGIEAVSMRKVADDLFLLVLNDGGPVGLTVLMDFAQARNVGMLFGALPWGMLSRPVGARIVMLGAVAYPPDRRPG